MSRVGDHLMMGSRVNVIRAVLAFRNQVSFFDGHVRAFEAIGAIPRRVVYDNLTAAVKRRVKTGERELNERFLALCAHYCYEPCFARPGEGHDKGGVEGRGKTIRLQHLTPIVEGATLPEISRRLQDDLDKRWLQAKTPDGRRVGDLYDEDQFSMKLLPPTPFDSIGCSPRAADRSSTATICLSSPASRRPYVRLPRS